MAERVISKEIGFDPQKMGQLETSLYRNLATNNQVGAFEARLKMYKEQWNMQPHVAASAIHFINSAGVFIEKDGKNKESETAASLLIYFHYHLVSRDSGLNFNPAEVTQAYIYASRKSSSKNPIPAEETATLFGLIYSINPNDETLVTAMDLRWSAFNLLHTKGFNKMQEEDWRRFEGYLTNYYDYLKLAASH